MSEDKTAHLMYIDDQIRAAEERIAALRAERNDVYAGQPLAVLADVCHQRYCQANHTDGCAWHYHPRDWSSGDHIQWVHFAADVKALIARGVISSVDEFHAVVAVYRRKPS